MKSMKGITLIALIITIIVMLILVGVTINIVINGGLFEVASDTAKKQEEQAIYDQIVGMAIFNSNGNINVAETYNAIKGFFGTENVSVLGQDGTFTVTGKQGTYTYILTNSEIRIASNSSQTDIEFLEEFMNNWIENDGNMEDLAEAGITVIDPDEGIISYNGNYYIVNITESGITIIPYQNYVEPVEPEPPSPPQDLAGKTFKCPPMYSELMTPTFESLGASPSIFDMAFVDASSVTLFGANGTYTYDNTTGTIYVTMGSDVDKPYTIQVLIENGEVVNYYFVEGNTIFTLNNSQGMIPFTGEFINGTDELTLSIDGIYGKIECDYYGESSAYYCYIEDSNPSTQNTGTMYLIRAGECRGVSCSYTQDEQGNYTSITIDGTEYTKKQ